MKKIWIALVVGLIFCASALSALDAPYSDQDAVVYVYRASPVTPVRGLAARYDVYINTTRVSNLTDKSFIVMHLKPLSFMLKVKSGYGLQSLPVTAVANQVQYFRVDTIPAQKAITITQVDESQALKDLVGMADRNEKIPRAYAYEGPKTTPATANQAPSAKTPQPTAGKSGPEISLTYPETKRGLSVVATNRVQHVEGKAKSAKGIFEVQVNGIQATLKADGSFSADVPLAIGENNLEIVARDTAMAETRQSFSVTRPADPSATPAAAIATNPGKPGSADSSLNSTGGHNYLMVIAINKYKYWPQLGNAVKDAKDVITVLTSRYQFSRNYLVEIYDEKATVDAIYNSFRELAAKLNEKDNLMIYFSGHGNYDKLLDEGFWIPVEARKANNTDYLPNSTISKLIKAIPAKHTFLVADACFSGSLFASGSRGYAENVEQYKSRWGLTSGRLEYVSDGKSGENSPFASYVLKYLRNASKDAPVSDMVQYVKTAVGNNSEQTPVGASLRNVGDEGGEFVFHLRK